MPNGRLYGSFKTHPPPPKPVDGWVKRSKRKRGQRIDLAKLGQERGDGSVAFRHPEISGNGTPLWREGPYHRVTGFEYRSPPLKTSSSCADVSSHPVSVFFSGWAIWSLARSQFTRSFSARPLLDNGPPISLNHLLRRPRWSRMMTEGPAALAPGSNGQDSPHS